MRQEDILNDSFLQYAEREVKGIRAEIKDLRTSLSGKAELERLETLEGRVGEVEAQLAKYRAQ